MHEGMSEYKQTVWPFRIRVFTNTNSLKANQNVNTYDTFQLNTQLV